ncbi:MAG: Acyltransferase [Frankiales bacterium]|nr:Acyltransferase [Frankiales bacterium]
MRPPPRVVRRPLQVVVVAVAALLLVGTLPVTVPLAVLAALLPSVRSRALRVLAYAVVLLLLEVLGLVAATGLFLLGRARDETLHYVVLRALLDEAVRFARLLGGLQLVTDELGWSPLDDGVPGSENAMLVLSRHAGPGDSLLLVQTLLDRDHLRRPRIVLKDLLRLDPLVDLYLGRLPSAFLPSGGDTEQLVADVARGLGTQDALLIFPEGGNFTPGRRRRAIEHLRGRGLEDAARKAERLRYLLPPKPGGVAAALQAAPHADVVFVAHAGLDDLSSPADLWRHLPLRHPVRLKWQFVDADDVPRDRAEQVDWLFRTWADMDAWIEQNRPRR